MDGPQTGHAKNLKHLKTNILPEFCARTIPNQWKYKLTTNMGSSRLAARSTTTTTSSTTTTGNDQNLFNNDDEDVPVESNWKCLVSSKTLRKRRTVRWYYTVCQRIVALVSALHEGHAGIRPSSWLKIVPYFFLISKGENQANH